MWLSQVTKSIRGICVSFFADLNTNPNLGLNGDLDDVELIMAVEAAFETPLADKDLEAVENVGELYDLLCSKSPNENEKQLWGKFVRVLAKFCEVPEDEIRRETEFFRYAH